MDGARGEAAGLAVGGAPQAAHAAKSKQTAAIRPMAERYPWAGLSARAAGARPDVEPLRERVWVRGTWRTPSAELAYKVDQEFARARIQYFPVGYHGWFTGFELLAPARHAPEAEAIRDRLVWRVCDSPHYKPISDPLSRPVERRNFARLHPCAGGRNSATIRRLRALGGPPPLAPPQHIWMKDIEPSGLSKWDRRHPLDLPGPGADGHTTLALRAG